MNRDELSALIDQGKRTGEIALIMGSTTRTVNKWRKEIGRVGEAHPTKYSRPEIERLIRDGKTPAEIHAIIGCSPESVSRIKRLMGLRAYHQGTDRDDLPAFVDPRIRLERALQVKSKRLGMPVEWVRETWLPAHREFLSEYPLSGGMVG